MNRSLLIPILVAAALLPGAPSSGGEVYHPSGVLAGTWRIPLFYQPAAPPAEAPEVRVVAGGDTLALPFRNLAVRRERPRFGLFLEEPVLAGISDGAIPIEVWAGDSAIYRGSIALERNLPDHRILTVEQEGEVVLWEGDGAGGLAPWDTVATGEPVVEAFLITGRSGSLVAVGVTGSGEVIAWTGSRSLRESFRVTLGGRPSTVAAGPSGREGYVGLLDGRIVRIDEKGADVVVSARGIPTSIAVGDADGDGVDDLVAVVLEVERSVLAVWPGKEDGGFDRQSPRVIPLPGTGRTVLFASIAGGESEDLLLLLHGANVGLSGVSLWSFAGPDTVRTVDLPGIAGKSVHRMLAGDWDGDGTTDLAVLTGVKEARVELFRVRSEDLSGKLVGVFPVGGPEVDLLAGDFDRNGADDIIAAQGEFRVWLSDGTGRVVSIPDPAAGRPARVSGFGGR